MTPPLRIHHFRHCLVFECSEARWLETRFADGSKVPAAPEPTDEYLARAVALGYSGDDPAWECCRAHELMHTLIAEARGWPWSSQLWALARGIEYDGWREESLVLGFQRWLNDGTHDPVLDALPDLERLGREARKLLGAAE